MENECNTEITITQTVNECQNNYTSTNCIATPNALTYLDLSAGASQTQINANIVSALMRKDEQISEITIPSVIEYSQKIIEQSEGLYTILEEDNNKGLIFNNLDEEEELEIIITVPEGLSQNFRTKVLKRQSGTIRILPEDRILRPNSTSNEIGNINDWVYIEKLSTTNNFIINGALGLPN